MTKFHYDIKTGNYTFDCDSMPNRDNADLVHLVDAKNCNYPTYFYGSQKWHIPDRKDYQSMGWCGASIIQEFLEVLKICFPDLEVEIEPRRIRK